MSSSYSETTCNQQEEDFAINADNEGVSNGGKYTAELTWKQSDG